MSDLARRVSIDLAVQAGGTTTRNASFGALATTKGGLVTTDLSNTDTTTSGGTSLTHPFLTVGTGITYTIGGNYFGAGTLTVNGTFILSGTGVIA